MGFKYTIFLLYIAYCSLSMAAEKILPIRDSRFRQTINPTFNTHFTLEDGTVLRLSRSMDYANDWILTIGEQEINMVVFGNGNSIIPEKLKTDVAEIKRGKSNLQLEFKYVPVNSGKVKYGILLTVTDVNTKTKRTVQVKGGPDEYNSYKKWVPKSLQETQKKSRSLLYLNDPVSLYMNEIGVNGVVMGQKDADLNYTIANRKILKSHASPGSSSEIKKRNLLKMKLLSNFEPAKIPYELDKSNNILVFNNAMMSNAESYSQNPAYYFNPVSQEDGKLFQYNKIYTSMESPYQLQESLDDIHTMVKQESMITKEQLLRGLFFREESHELLFDADVSLKYLDAIFVEEGNIEAVRKKLKSLGMKNHTGKDLSELVHSKSAFSDTYSKKFNFSNAFSSTEACRAPVLSTIQGILK